MNNQDKQLIVLNKESGQEYQFSLNEQNGIAYGAKKTDAKVEFAEDDFSFMSANGISYPVEIISSHQNEYELLINGVSYTFSIETPFSLQRKKMLTSQASESTTIRLKAPMPGKILEVMVKTGDAVKAGDTTSKSDLLIELEKEG